MKLNGRIKMDPIDDSSITELTLRDFFAAFAMQAFITKGEPNKHHLTTYAYEMADLMMEKRDE
jgi:hypothetical protein